MNPLDAAKTNTSTIPEEQTVDMDVSTQNDKVEERTSSDNHDTNKPESNSANIEIGINIFWYFTYFPEPFLTYGD